MILYQKDFFEKEKSVLESFGAKALSGLCTDEDIEFEPIIARGSISFVNSVKSACRNKGWPDLTWPFNQTWARYGYSYLLNSNGGKPLSDLLNDDAQIYFETDFCTEKLKPSYIKGRYDFPLWMRSESGCKVVAGGLYTEDQFDLEWEYLKQNGRGEEWMVVASAKDIKREWRLLVVNNSVVSSSLYMKKGPLKEKRGAPKEVLDFGQAWCDKWGRSWNHFALDVCEHEGKLKVVEVNNLLTSGWYKADAKKVFQAIYESIPNSQS